MCIKRNALSLKHVSKIWIELRHGVCHGSSNIIYLFLDMRYLSHVLMSLVLFQYCSLVQKIDCSAESLSTSIAKAFRYLPSCSYSALLVINKTYIQFISNRRRWIRPSTTMLIISSESITIRTIFSFMGIHTGS